jgi:hypothetical protein
MRPRTNLLAPARAWAVLAWAIPAAGLAPAQDAAKHDWKPVAAILRAPGKTLPDGTFRVDVPRKTPELRNELGFVVPASMVLTYAAFTGSPEAATVVGDTCMLGSEVNPVIDALRKGGVEIVAIHNHMLGGNPNFVFLHFQAAGSAVAIARTVRAAWDEMEREHPLPDRPPTEPPQPDWKAVSDALGLPGTMTHDGVFKASLPRPELGTELDGKGVPAGAGLACWVGFAPCACGETMIMGDTCLRRSELQQAIDGYRRHGIRIIALHNHMLGTSPELVFCHFGAEGDAVALARAVRSVWKALEPPGKAAGDGK